MIDAWAAVTFLRVNHKRQGTSEMAENYYSPGLCLLITLKQQAWKETETHTEGVDEGKCLCFYACQVWRLQLKFRLIISPADVNYTLKPKSWML